MTRKETVVVLLYVALTVLAIVGLYANPDVLMSEM